MATNNQNSNNPNYTAGLPTPESYEQILSNMLSTYASLVGVNDFNTGSLVTSFFETVALAVARASGDSFQILNNFSIDRATGFSLQNLAIENGVTPLTARPATGNVNVIDTSFVEISTKIYAGANPPNIGSTQISVSDASKFPASGTLYIGRGTPNIEGPISYSSVTPTGGFFVITLSSPTTKFHNLGETVIVGQGGNRNIPVGSIVISPASGSSPNIQYTVTSSAVILDGETEVDGVQVTAVLPGSSGNVPAGSIKEFATPPFSGATVSNPLSFVTGADTETDDQLRVRIKNALASTGLGTATAVESACIGATPFDENVTVVSDNIVINTDGSATLYIDDGTGYEAKTAGVGLEHIVDSALGGEQFFQLATGGTQAPVAKAFLISSLTSPFNLVGGDSLAITVGEVTYQHTFATKDFLSPGAATAFEVAASVNANTTLGFEATTSGGGTFVVFRAIAESNDSLQVATPTGNGGNAAILLGLPSSQVQTLRLYKNGQPLSKDGNIAELFSQQQTFWSNGIASGDTLILSIDGTSPITYTITNADFIATGLYTTVAATNSLASWQQVFNSKLTGATVSIVGSQLVISSNLGANNRAQATIVATGSSLVTKGMFGGTQSLTSQGQASDFTLDRNTAQFQLVKPLVAGDVLSAGNESTQASVESAQIPSGNVTLTAEGHIWMLLDNPGTLISTGVIGNTQLTVSTTGPNLVNYTSSVSGAFSNVLAGDYVIIWSAELAASNRLEGRVHSVTGTVLTMEVTAAEYTAITPQSNVTFFSGFVVLRSTLAPQKFTIPANTYTLDAAAAEIASQSVSITAVSSQEEFIIIKSETKNTSGSVLIVTADAQGQLLGISAGSSGQSSESLIAFFDSSERDADFPLFVHSSFTADSLADPIDSFITSISSSVFGSRDPNELISILQPYGAIDDAQPAGEYVQVESISGSTVDITPENLLVRLRGNIDRFFIANPLDFGHQDTSVVVLDGNTASESFSIPFYRTALTNNAVASNTTTFNAYDVSSGPTSNFSSSFGSSFSFANYKAYMQAKKTLKPTPSQTALLYRSATWGRSGQFINVGYSYPSGPNLDITSAIMIGANVSILIGLKSGTSITTSISGSTQWNVTITSNTPSAGIDQVTYTWNGSGANPNLTLSGGEYVNIGTATGFNVANTGVFRVSTQSGFTPTSTSFSVQRATGSAVAQSGVFTTAPSSFIFYNNSSTTAAQINTYVNANLSNYVSSTIVNDGGVTGSGIIVLSTYEDSGFVSPTVQLLDGLNWISTSNLTGSPQFTFKQPLSLPTDIGYAFNNGESVILVPTTMEQVSQLISVLAVTGFSTLGTINLANRGTRLELATDTVGSNGSIQIIGGLANQYSVPVLNAATRVNNSLSSINTNAIASAGIHSDQWFRLQAATAQNKQTLFNNNTSVSVTGTDPMAGQSLVNLFGRTLTQRYLGKPRHHIRSQGDTFRIEQQGNLVCLSWNGVGTSPGFLLSSVNFNASSGGTLNANLVSGTSDVLYTILTGNGNFNGLSIGDLVTISGLPVSANNGTFLVTGVSDDGTQLQVTNPSGANEFSSGTFTFTGNSTVGDVYTVNGINYTAGSTFAVGANANATATNLAASLASLPNTSTSVAINTPVSGEATVTVTSTAAIPTISTNYVGSNVVNDSNTFSLTANNSSGDTYTVNGNNFVAGVTFAIGTGSYPANATITAANLASAINSLSGVLATASGTVVKVVSTVTGTGVSIGYKGTSVVTVSGIFVVTANNTAGDKFTVAGVPLIAGVSFAVGGTSQITAGNLSSAIGSISGITSSASGNVVTVYATSVGQSVTLAYTGTPVVTVSGANVTGDSYSGSTFSASTSVSEGDTLYITPSTGTYTSPFSSLNQGRYRVIRRYNDSVWFENSNAVEQEVTLPLNSVQLGFDTTTTFTINASSHTLKMFWTGNGTEPFLGNANVGDIVNLSDPSVLTGNTGNFMVLDSGAKLQQITQIICPSGSVFPLSGAGPYFTISNANVNNYYIWFNTGANTNPGAPIGYPTGASVSITSGMTSSQVATALQLVIQGLTGLSATVSGNIVTVTTATAAPAPNANNVNVPSPFSISTTQSGTRTFLECVNPSAVNQSSFSFASTSNFICHRPQFQFYEYQATVPGDVFAVSGTALGVQNVGNYTVIQVLDRNDMIVSGTLANVANASINGQISSINVVEGVPYSGYKHVKFVASTPGVPTLNTVTFTTNNQFESINQSAGVELTSLSKTNFSTALNSGLDSYKYNTGLIRECNRIVYGDPRDPATYPGVGAAGANIFIKEPLALRVQVSIVVRINTGVPFPQLVTQIQSAVASFIQSNPIGQSIPISGIVSAVNAIVGVRAVSIASPLYNSTNDLIFLAPNEKAFILNPSTDISVSQITS